MTFNLIRVIGRKLLQFCQVLVLLQPGHYFTFMFHFRHQVQTTRARTGEL